MSSASQRPSRSLSRQLALWYFATSLLVVLVASAVLYWAAVQALHWADDQVALKRMEAVRAHLQDPRPSASLVAHEVSEDNQGPRQIFIRIVTAAADFAMETPEMPPGLLPSRFPDPAGDGPPRSVTLNLDGGKAYRVLAVRVPIDPAAGATEAVLQVAIDTSLDGEALAWYRRLLAAVIAAAVLVTSLLAWFVVKRKLEPVHQIAQATTEIGTSTLDKRLELDGLPAELHDLGVNFNAMLGRLEASYDGLRHYADNIAHELRTPLNRMLLAAEVTLSKERPVPEIKEALESNMDECRTLADLVQELLFLARAENGQTSLDKRRVAIRRELDIIAAGYRPDAEDSGVTLATEAEPGLEANLDKVLFQRALSNLVVNALKHTPRGGRVDLRAASEGGRVVIEVRDTGHGIEPQDLPHVFDRFYRAGRPVEGSGGTEGVGLGLSIADSIVRLHGGRIRVESEPGKGTAFRVEL